MNNSTISAQANNEAVTVEKGYNGWANYETWCVNLWLSNDYTTYNQLRSWVRKAGDTYAAARLIQDFVEELNPLQDKASMFADLLNAALSEVDWVEIAEDFLEQ